jgi:hypothetical protein
MALCKKGFVICQYGWNLKKINYCYTYISHTEFYQNVIKTFMTLTKVTFVKNQCG